MGEMIPQGSLIRLGDRDRKLDEIEAVRLSSYEENLPEDQWLMSLQAGIERENYTSRWVNDKIRHWGRPNPRTIGFDPDPNYKFEDDDENFGYDPMIMVEANSAGEARQFRSQIDKEMGELKTIAASNWGVTGEVFGGIMQPHVAASLAIAPVSVVGAVAAEVALETVSEVALHNMEKTRTIEESYWNVGLTGMAVAILGSAAKGFTKLGKPPKDIIDEINSGIYPGGSGDSAGAARALQEDRISREEDQLVGGKLANIFSIGQMSHLVNSLSDSARSIAQKLADNPLFTRAHTKGKTRGVTVESLHEAAMGRVVIATDNVSKLQKQSGLDVDDFENQIGIAMSNGDKSPNPKVQEAAELYRSEVIDPIREASERLGLLESADELKVKVTELEVTVKQMIEGAEGSKVARETIETKRAKYVLKADKKTAELQKEVDATQKKLDAARKPTKSGKERTAPPSMIKAHNDARSLLSAHKKVGSTQLSEYKARLKELDTQKKNLAKSRKDLREAKARLESPGVAFAESYFPRIYKKEAIFENWDELQFKLEEHFKANPQLSAKLDAPEITDLAIDTLQNMVAGRSQRISGKGKPTALRARVLSLIDNELEPYLEKNATQGMIRHAQAMQPYLLMREAFDGRTMDEMMETITDDYKVLLAKEGLSGKERDKLMKAMTDDKDNLKVVHDRLMHQVQRAVNPRGASEKIVQFAKVLNTATYLMNVVITSIPDLARPIANYGLRSFGKGLVKGFSQMLAGKGSMESVQVKRTGAALQRTLNDRVMQLTDSLEPQTKLNAMFQKGWQKISGFDYWTDTMESIAAHSAMDWLLRMSQRSLAGKTLGKADIRQLARMGLNAEDLALIARESEGTMGMQDSVLKYMNTMEWTDPNFAKRVEAAIGSDVRRTIIRIGAGEKPQFMDETTWSWLFQFQSFAMSAQNKIMVAGMQNLMTIRTAQSLVSMMALGAGVGALKATVRGEDVSEWPPGQWVAEGIDRSGMSGILRIPFNMLRYAGSQSDIGQEMFGEPSRFVGREIEGVLAGPTMSTLGRAWRGTSSLIEGDTEKAMEHFMKATPFLNAWHIRNVLMDMGDN